MVNWLNQLGVPIDRLTLPNWGLIKRCKKPSISSSSFSFPIEGYVFLVDVRSRISRGLTVTCHAFNVQRLMNWSTPTQPIMAILFPFWLRRLETYKLKVPLHLWVREAFICLPTCSYIKSSHSFLGALNLHMNIL